MFCSISGTVPEEPVLNVRSGHLYERRLIAKVVEQTGRDPVTQDETSLSDLVSVRSNRAAKPRPVGASTVGGMLALLTTEFDALLLEGFKLRTELEATRSELSQALYQHDAACRVIARLIRERDTAREATGAAQSAAAARIESVAADGAAGAPAEASAASAGGADAGVVAAAAGAPAGITEVTIAAIKDRHKELTKGRKKRAVPAETASAGAVSALSKRSSFTPHAVSPAGITALDVFPGARHGLVATGGADKNALVFDASGSGRIVARLSGHSKRVSSVAWAGGNSTAGVEARVLTGSLDGSVKLWSGAVSADAAGAPASWEAAVSLHPHPQSGASGSAGEVVAVAVHPLSPFAASASSDGTWAFLDLGAARTLVRLGAPGGSRLECGKFHPDGMLYAAGAADASVRIFDVRTQTSAATFEGHSGPVGALSFSENGFYMASASDDASVRLWDLRKLACFQTLQLAGNVTAAAATAVAFDFSGGFLAAGFGDGGVAVWSSKDWAQLVGAREHSARVTGLGWGAHARELYSSSMDRALIVYAAAESSAMHE